MMLRALLAGLLVANAGVYAWSQGWLGAGAPQGGRDPARLQRQVNPQAVRVLPVPAAASGLAVSASVRTACLEAGPLDVDQATVVEAALREAQWPPSRWRSSEMLRPGVWIVHLGRYPEPEALRRRQAELERQGIEFQPVQDAPELEPGLQLGRYDSAEAAESAMAAYTARGGRQARVVELTAPQRLPVLRLEGLDATTAAALAANATAGRFFRPCAAEPSAG